MLSDRCNHETCLQISNSNKQWNCKGATETMGQGGVMPESSLTVRYVWKISVLST